MVQISRILHPQTKSQCFDSKKICFDFRNPAIVKAWQRCENYGCTGFFSKKKYRIF